MNNEIDNNESTAEDMGVAYLLNELAYRRYLFNKDNIGKFLNKLSNPEYVALCIVKKTEEDDDIYLGKTYLKDLAERMQLPMRHVSKMVGNLKDRGFLVWEHDGDGSEGTYVAITDEGSRLLADEEKRLKAYYETVIEKFGRENLIKMLQLMKQLETVMSAEFEEWKEKNG